MLRDGWVWQIDKLMSNACKFSSNNNGILFKVLRLHCLECERVTQYVYYVYLTPPPFAAIEDSFIGDVLNFLAYEKVWAVLHTSFLYEQHNQNNKTFSGTLSCTHHIHYVGVMYWVYCKPALSSCSWVHSYTIYPNKIFKGLSIVFMGVFIRRFIAKLVARQILRFSDGGVLAFCRS